jgi:magnesium-transporting ATPase (P-type)
MCFDKTGTLTEDTVELHKVFTFVSEGFKDITAVSN